VKLPRRHFVSSEIAEQDDRFIHLGMEGVGRHSDRSVQQDAKREDRCDENADSCLDLGGAEVNE
jgi:hypothetical protein